MNIPIAISDGMAIGLLIAVVCIVYFGAGSFSEVLGEGMENLAERTFRSYRGNPSVLFAVGGVSTTKSKAGL